jgi:hypothetical protein
MPLTNRIRDRKSGVYAREWVPLSAASDEVLARMTVTYLEAAHIEARVVEQADQFCVEVPLEQLDHACAVCGPVDSGIFPTMQEASGNTGMYAAPPPSAEVQRPASDSNLARNIVLCLGALALMAALVWRVFIA